MPDPITPPGQQPDPTQQQPAGTTAAPPIAPPPAGAAAPKANPFEDPIVGARIRTVRATAEASARAKLLAELGIDDPEKFKVSLSEKEKKLAEYEQKKAESERANMSEVERLKADLAQRDQRIAELESQLREREVDVQAAKFDVVVREAIGDAIDPTMREDAQEALRRHIRTLPKEQQRRFGQPEAEAFFRKLAKEKPRYARDAGSAPPRAAPVKRPLTNGASPAKAAGTPAPKVPPTATPGNGAKPKTKEEVAAGWKKFGTSRPY